MRLHFFHICCRFPGGPCIGAAGAFLFFFLLSSSESTREINFSNDLPLSSLLLESESLLSLLFKSALRPGIGKFVFGIKPSCACGCTGIAYYY